MVLLPMIELLRCIGEPVSGSELLAYCLLAVDCIACVGSEALMFVLCFYNHHRLVMLICQS